MVLEELRAEGRAQPARGRDVLMPTGTPKSGGSAAPRLRAAAARRASHSAASRASVTMAFTFGLTASTRSISACTTSSGDTLRAR